jgi:hypothetical protein
VFQKKEFSEFRCSCSATRHLLDKTSLRITTFDQFHSVSLPKCLTTDTNSLPTEPNSSNRDSNLLKTLHSYFPLVHPTHLSQQPQASISHSNLFMQQLCKNSSSKFSSNRNENDLETISKVTVTCCTRNRRKVQMQNAFSASKL